MSDSRPQPGGVLGETDPLIGLTISGRYRVHALLGQGGMGKVFRAQQIPLGRAVALKVLEAHRVDQEFHRRFFQEAAILARLRSPHTVTIYDYGRDGDLYFIAMELVSGGSLDKVLAAEGPLPAARVVSIAQQICRSLREAHGQGVIHRDLKPANVVMARGEEGEELAKVLDFGLAKRVNTTVPDDDDTENDVVPGSPKYMAPEVIRQQPIDGRTDIYSLGVMMYQMVAGSVPFDRPNAVDILYAHLHEAPVPLSQRNPRPQVPPKLEQLIMACIAKSPDQRPANVRQLHDALTAIAADLNSRRRSKTPLADPSGVRRSSLPRLRLTAEDLTPAFVRTATRGRGRMLLAAGALLALLALGLFLLRPGARTDAPLPPAATSDEEPAGAAAALAAQAPVAQPAAAQEAAAEEPKPAADSESADMVFTAHEADEPAANNSVALIVTSEPPGARVILRGKQLGVTPGRFELRGRVARPGTKLMVRLALVGYARYTVERTVDGPELEIAAQLEPLPRVLPKPEPPAPPALEAAEAPPAPDEEAEEEEEEEEPAESEEPDAPAPEPGL